MVLRVGRERHGGKLKRSDRFEVRNSLAIRKEGRKETDMNLLSPGDLILAVRSRSLCTVTPPVIVPSVVVASEEVAVSYEGLLVGQTNKKEKKRRSSLNEASPSRKASFFQRYTRWEEWGTTGMNVDDP